MTSQQLFPLEGFPFEPSRVDQILLKEGGWMKILTGSLRLNTETQWGNCQMSIADKRIHFPLNSLLATQTQGNT